MTPLTVELPDAEGATLALKARSKKLSVELYARQALEQDLAPDWLQKSWQTAIETGIDRLKAEEIDAEISAARNPR